MNASPDQKSIRIRFTVKAIMSVAGIILATSVTVSAAAPRQTSCLHSGIERELAKKLAERKLSADQTQAAEEKALATEIQRAAADLSDSERNLADTKMARKNETASVDSVSVGSRALVCRVLLSVGLPTNESFGPQAVASFFFLASRVLTRAEILEIYPAIERAYQDKLIGPGPQLASLVDRTRLALGRKQVFGTQVFLRDDLLVLAPIEKPEDIDRRRSEFGLEPLRRYEKALQNRFRMPLVRSFQVPATDSSKAISSAAEPTSKPAESVSPLEINPAEPEIRINTALVRIDVLVRDAVSQNAAQLTKNDFLVFDNGRPVDIEFFGKSESPFDIVLLLDLSGSTANKAGLIRKAAKKFIEAKRPEDRIAIVVFTDQIKLVSDFENDREILLQRVKDIRGFGGTFVWDAFWYALDMLGKSAAERRRAIVALTDGLDNQLRFSGSDVGSKTSFADLAERVSRENVVIFPVYLDTERDNPPLRDSYRAARTTLRYLADSSGGNFYTVKKLESVEALYDEVLLDVGAIYTLGFSPELREGDPLWHSLKVEVPSRPNLQIRYRPGYFAQ